MAMILDADLQAMRDCCRDEAAFERLQNILARYLKPPALEPALETLESPPQLWYNAILQALPDRVFLVDRQGDSLNFKGTLEDAEHGFSRETVVGTNLRDFLPDAIAQRCLAAIARTLDTGELQMLEYQLPNAWSPDSGDRRDYEVRLVVSGAAVLGIERDITDRKRIEAALYEREYRYRSLYNNTPAMLQSIDRHHRLISVSDHWLSSLGYTRSEVLGRKAVEFMTPASQDYAETIGLPAYLNTGVCTDVPYQFVKKNGDVMDVLLSAIAERDAEGTIVRSLSVLTDVTERTRSEQALRESEEKFSIAFRCSPTAITLTTLQPITLARIIDVNDSFLHITGYQRAEVIGLTVAALDLWVDLPARAQLLQKLQASESVHNLEMKFRRKSGEIGVALLSAEIIHLQGIPCLQTVTIDITDRKRTEEALHISEARNLAFLNAIPDMMFRIRRDGTYLDCKADQDSDFAIPSTDMIGKTVAEVLPPEAAQQRMAYIERTLETGEIQIFEYQLLNQGELRDYEARLVVSGKDEVLAIVRDMTRRKRAIAQLQATAERDRLLGLIALRIRRSLNLDQILTTTVAEVRQFLQVDRVFIGQIDATWQGKILAESAAPAWGSILSWVADDIYLREIRALFAQGEVRAIDNTATAAVPPLLTDYYQRCHIQASLGVPIILGEELFGVLVANQCYQPRHWAAFEIRLLEQLAVQVAIAVQQAKLYQQVQSLATNLEQQVQERTAQLQQKMLELQELSQTKDDFLNAVSHDLRTPIMGTMMVLKNLQQKSGDTVVLSRSVLDRMVQSSDRQLSMINSLLEAHSSEAWGLQLQYEHLNLGHLVRTIVDDLEPLLLDNQATLTNQVSPDLPLVTADPAMIRRVFENLLTNALKYNSPGLHLTLEATIEDDLLRCSVQDNGVGMTPDECDALFERYARGTHARRSTGIGLGLYLCRQIITAHGGQIGAISAPGEGATFWFTLPLAP